MLRVGILAVLLLVAVNAAVQIDVRNFDLNMLDGSLTAHVFDVELGQDIALAKVDHRCAPISQTTCAAMQAVCQPCAVDGGSVTFRGNVCTQRTSADGCSCLLRDCSAPTIPLVDGQTYNYSMAAGELFFSFELPSLCHGWTLTPDEVVAQTQATQGQLMYAWNADGILFGWSYYVQDGVQGCPLDPRPPGYPGVFHRPGSVIVRVVPALSVGQLSMTLRFVSPVVPDADLAVAPQASAIALHNATHQTLTEFQDYIWTVDASPVSDTYYEFPLTQFGGTACPQYVSIMLGAQVFLSASPSMWASFTELRPNATSSSGGNANLVGSSTVTYDLDQRRTLTMWVPAEWTDCSGRSLYLTVRSVSSLDTYWLRAQSRLLPLTVVPVDQIESLLTKTSIMASNAFDPLLLYCPVLDRFGTERWRYYYSSQAEASFLHAHDKPLVLRPFTRTLEVSNNVSFGIHEFAKSSWGTGPISPSKLIFVALDTATDKLVAPERCELMFRGIADLAGNMLPTPDNLAINVAPPTECTVAAFSEFRQLFTAVQSELEQSTTVSDINTAIGNINMLFASDIWRSCESGVQQLFQRRPITVTDISMSCDSPAVPPMCCETQSTQRIDDNAFTPDAAAARRFCPAASSLCLEQFQREYADAVNPANLVSCRQPLTDGISEENRQRSLFILCQEQVYGINFNKSVPCTFDSNGDALPCATGECDIFTGRCVYTPQVAEEAFLTCLDNNLSPLVLSSLRASLGIDDGQPLSDARQLMLSPSCLSNSKYFDWKVTPRSATGPQNDVEEVRDMTDTRSTTAACMIGPAAHGLGAGFIAEAFGCIGSIIDNYWFNNINVSKTQCEQARRCNYRTPACPTMYPTAAYPNAAACQQSCTQLAADGARCAYCHNSDPCELVSTTNPAPCEQQVVCVWEGHTKLVASAAECDAFGTCSQPCFDTRCADAVGLTNAGLCIDTNSSLASLDACTAARGALAGTTCSFSQFSTAAQCAAANLTWIVNDCLGLTESTCALCEAGDQGCPLSASASLRCVVSLVDRPCVDRAECESSQRCNDRLLLAPYLEVLGQPKREYVCLEAKSEQFMFVPCGDPSITHVAAVPYGPVCALLQDSLYRTQNGTQCALENGMWRKLAHTQAQCEAYSLCHEVSPEQVYSGGAFAAQGLLPYSAASYLSPRPSDECTQTCKGSMEPAFRWGGGTWRSAQAKTLTTLAPAYDTFASWSSTGRVDYLQLTNFVTAALAAASTERYSQFYFCATPRRVEALTAIIGLCATNETAEQKELLTPRDSGISVLRVCNGAESKVLSARVSAFFPADSLTTPGCTSLLVSSYSSTAFAKPSVTELMQFYASPYANYRPYEAVITDLGFAYGQLVGEGVFATSLALGDSPAQSLSVGSLCSALDPTLPRYPAYKSGRLDFAQRTGSFRVKALYGNVTLRNIVLLEGEEPTPFACLNFASQEEFNNLFINSDEPIYPVLVGPVSDSSLTKGERSSLYIVGVMYALTAWFFMLVQARMFILHDFVVALTCLRVFLALAFVVRAVYFILVANDQIFGGTAANLALGLLPGVFLFSALSCLVIVWSHFAISRKIGHSKAARILMPVIFVIVNGVVYAVFIALIVAGSLAGENHSVSCYGRIEKTDSTTQTATAASLLGFEIILAIVVSLLLVTLAVRLHMVLRHMGSRNKSLLITALGCAIVYILSCIVMLITAVTPTSPYLCWLIAAVEIPALVCIMVLISWYPTMRAANSKSSSEPTPSEASNFHAISSWRV